MRPLLTIIFVVKLGLATGQDFSYPTIKNEGQTINDFVPVGWTVHDSASGDLNNDQRRDLAIVLQFKDSVTILQHRDTYTDTVKTRPRVLVILFRDQSSEKYLLAEQNNTFILNHDNPTRDDPYQSIKIEKGILQIDFYLFYNLGSWWVTNSSYKFRYENKMFVLIGADKNSFHRATHDYENYSFNFLTKKWTLIKGNEENGKKDTTSHTLDLKELKSFKTFKQPYTWEVTKEIYL